MKEKYVQLFTMPYETNNIMIPNRIQKIWDIQNISYYIFSETASTDKTLITLWKMECSTKKIIDPQYENKIYFAGQKHIVFHFLF